MEKQLQEDILDLSNEAIEEMSSDDFDSLISGALDAVDELLDKNDTEFHISATPSVEQIAREDEEAIKDITREETAQQVQRDLEKARDSEKEKYKNVYSYEDAIADILMAVKSQIADYKQAVRTYRVPNKKLAFTNVIAKGEQNRVTRGVHKPSIALFIEVSSSWNTSDSEKAEKLVASLVKYDKDDEIDLDIYYFANRVGTTPIGLGGGTGAWPEIVDYIYNGPNKDNIPYLNVVLVTDDDIPDWSFKNDDAKNAFVNGYVWLVWKNKRDGDSVIKRSYDEKTGNSKEYTARDLFKQHLRGAKNGNACFSEYVLY